ncbi:MAG: hypothetical protein JOS17DRAFT_793277 [Linnemannia elongata]|nr:MAG: hypothetical protein JOS17DRAFT_793277 [Linnemannia elongata]
MREIQDQRSDRCEVDAGSPNRLLGFKAFFDLLDSIFIRTLVPTNNDTSTNTNTHSMTSSSPASSPSRPGPTGQSIPGSIDCLSFSKTISLAVPLTKAWINRHTVREPSTVPTSRRHNSIAIQSNDDLPATVLTYYNPVGSPPASPLQLDDDAETAQPHPDLADLAATAAEPLPTPGLASQPVQILPQLRSPALSPTDVTSVTISESFDYETDMDVEPGAADEDDM